MGSQHPPGYYDEQSLRAIEVTLHEVCAELAKRHLTNGCESDGLRIAIVQRLLKLVEEGITDAIELRTTVLGYFDGQSHV
jgi:hypothetical protein